MAGIFSNRQRQCREKGKERERGRREKGKETGTVLMVADTIE